MGRLTELVFDESCCDGGEVCEKDSCQPCGCDPKASWACEQHREPVYIASEGQILTEDGHAYVITELSAKDRKQRPLASGVLDYFPDALMEVAYCSFKGNEQHNPGQPLHWAKEKSTDEPDALMRHLKDRGKIDDDGVRHSAKVAWRALAMLQREIEEERGN